MVRETAVFDPPKTVRVHPWVRGWSRFLLLLKRPWLLRRVRRPVIETVDGVPLVVFPQVLNPVVFRSGEMLARTIAESPLLETDGVTPRPLALDMGTGSGVGAVFAARRGFSVIAVDLNPHAVRCARVNALVNGVENQIEVRQGDLFAPVQEHQFDLILFNPPFFRGEPKGDFDLAWRATDVLERFAAGLARHLKPRGLALVILSTDGDAAGMLRALADHELQTSPVAQRHWGNEIMTIYGVRPPVVGASVSPRTSRQGT